MRQNVSSCSENLMGGDIAALLGPLTENNGSGDASPCGESDCETRRQRRRLPRLPHAIGGEREHAVEMLQCTQLRPFLQCRWGLEPTEVDHRWRLTNGTRMNADERGLNGYARIQCRRNRERLSP